MIKLIVFFCLIFIASVVIRNTLYCLESGAFKKILHVLDFGGVIVHEVGHTIACLLMGFPVEEIHFGWRSKYSGRVAPHGYVNPGNKRKTFLQALVIGFAPLFLSTWLFILCLDVAFNALFPDLTRIFCGIACISLVLGAAPSGPDLSYIAKHFNQDTSYSLYQILLLTLSIITTVLLLITLKIMRARFLQLN